MIRTYTLPYGVVPEVPKWLVPYVMLGDVGSDGLVRSFKVDRCPMREVPTTDVAVSHVTVSTVFEDEEVLVRVRIVIHWRNPSVFNVREGLWSVQEACVLPNHFDQPSTP